MDYTKYNKNIKKLLIDFGITQAEIAKMLQISSVSFSNKMTGKTEFTISQATKMKMIFKTKTLDEIFLD